MTYPITHSRIHAFTHSRIHSFTLSLIHSFIQTFFTHSLHLFIHCDIPTVTYLSTVTYPILLYPTLMWKYGIFFMIYPSSFPHSHVSISLFHPNMPSLINLLWHIYCDISNRTVSYSHVKIWYMLYDISKLVLALARFKFTQSPNHIFNHSLSVISFTHSLIHSFTHSPKHSSLMNLLWHIFCDISNLTVFNSHVRLRKCIWHILNDISKFVLALALFNFTHAPKYSFTHLITVTYVMWHISSHCNQFSCSPE